MNRPDWWQDLSAPEFAWQLPGQLNIAEECTTRQDPGSVALVVDRQGDVQRYTYGQLTNATDSLARALAALGLAAGDRMGVMVPQGFEVLTAHLAGFRAGLITVPLSVKFGPQAVSHRLADSGASVLVVDREGFDRIAHALPELPELRTVVVVGDLPEGEFPFRMMSFPEALAMDAPTVEFPRTTPETPAIIIYTSGTTGRPKGALHGHRILPAHMPGVRLAFDDAPQGHEVFWTPADWAWIGGLFDVLFPALAMGATVVAFPERFDAQRVVDVLAENAVTLAFVPPTALKQLRSAGLDEQIGERTRMRCIATGGESLGPSLYAWVRETFGVVVNEFYGQTEVNMVLGTQRGLREAPENSMGRAFPGFDVKVLDAVGDQCPAGEAGEISVRETTAGAFQGYWQQPEKTREKVVDGWIRTGDLGIRDQEGNFWYQGRTDDVISSAGYRIGPGEIEESLISHPAVAMAAVIGAPDETRGQAVHAFVTLNQGHADSPELQKELQDHVKQRLAFYQYPRGITVVDELPMTTTGKIMRRELRDRRLE